MHGERRRREKSLYVEENSFIPKTPSQLFPQYNLQTESNHGEGRGNEGEIITGSATCI